MRLAGRIWKEGRHWLVEVPMLDLMTQGHTKKDAAEMIRDAVECLVDDPSFTLTVHVGSGGHIELSGSPVGTLVALMLRRQRERSGLSLRDVARRLKQRSRNAYARYEQGQSVPTIEKLDELLAAVGADRTLLIGQSSI